MFDKTKHPLTNRNLDKRLEKLQGQIYSPDLTPEERKLIIEEVGTYRGR
jgi:hypothetical protein